MSTRPLALITGGSSGIGAALAEERGAAVEVLTADLATRTLYAAVKSATVAFTRTLAAELAGTGVSATVVCPGVEALHQLQHLERALVVDGNRTPLAERYLSTTA